MIKHADNFKSPRLSLCRWLIAFALGCLALSVFAQQQIPYNGPSNIEMKKTANTYSWVPATSGPGKGVVFQSGAGISDVTPKMTGQTQMPYTNKAAASRLTFTAPLNTSTMARAAAQAATGAATGALAGSAGGATGALAGAAFGAFGLPLATVLVDMGLEYFAPDPQNPAKAQYQTFLSPTEQEKSDGFEYQMTQASDAWYASAGRACMLGVTIIAGRQTDGWTVSGGHMEGEICKADYFRPNGQKYDELSWRLSKRPSACPAGHFIHISGDCYSTPPTRPVSESELESLLKKQMDDHWNSQFAEIAAATIAAGIYRIGDLFTDDPTVAGPDAVPISETVGTWPVNVMPGTTEIAAPGYTGQTDPGTQTKTDTTVAKNSYDKNTMTTSTQTTSKTSVTNNITNNTSTSVTTNITQTDQAPPKEEEKSDHCKENKDTLGCAELDEVEQDLPQKKIDITYEYTSLFGNGSCPADKHLTTHYGQSLKVWDWQVSCDHIVSSFQPVLLICCAFAGFVIVALGAKE